MNETHHLDPERLFLLALPPAGEPEALPAHLSECPDCARQFGEWTKACRDLAAEDAEPPADFERSVMSEVRRRRAPRSHRARRRWAAGLAAAAALLLAFGIGLRVGNTRVLSPSSARSGMSAADLGDDALLRDVSRLVAGDDDAAWKDLAPLPSSGGPS